MAQIDVSDILSDPDFIDPITLVDRKPAINNFGENTLCEFSFNSFGSVQPISGKALQRLPEFLRVANLRSFWFKGNIVASEPGKYSAILVFKGQRFQVQHVFDWTNWGQGWCEGACIAEVPAP